MAKSKPFVMKPVRRAFLIALRELVGADADTVTREQVVEAAENANVAHPYWLVDDMQYRSARGVYTLPTAFYNDLDGNGDESVAVVTAPKAKAVAPKVAPVKVDAPSPRSAKIDEILKISQAKAKAVDARADLSVGVESVSDSLVFDPDPNFVPWGHFKDIKTVMKSKVFHPMFITGLSGNGKTKMVEEAAAELKREIFVVPITEETDEDDLIGGFRLVDGNTVWMDGPVVRAMERGAILLLDELDRGDHKMMCLQTIIEGKPIYLKKAGRLVRPANGFNVFSTANTKGKGDDTGMFAGTNILNEAFLERFPITIEQPYPTKAVEKKILNKWAKHLALSVCDELTKFITDLVEWGEVVRKAYFGDSIDDVITTRRLLHILTCLSMFGSYDKAIEMTTARFDTETQRAMSDLWIAISNPPEVPETPVAPANDGAKDGELDTSPF